jgi:hypothetical protein
MPSIPALQAMFTPVGAYTACETSGFVQAPIACSHHAIDQM